METPVNYTCDRCRLPALPPGRTLHVVECQCGVRWAYCSECGGNSQVADALLDAHYPLCRLGQTTPPPAA